MGRFSTARGAGVFVVALGLSAASQATALTFEGTVLMGAKGVLVGSTLYDVTFGDQPLAPGDFFTAPSDNTAANALFTTLVDANKTDAHQVTSINGCAGNCVAVVMSSATYQSAYKYAAYLSFVPRPNGVPSYLVTENFAIIPSTSMASVSGQTWTHWTVETAPVTSVPEPETYAMLLAGLGLIGAAVKRRKAKQA